MRIAIAHRFEAFDEPLSFGALKLKIYHPDSGPSSTVIYMVHGALRDHRCWQKQIEYFINKGVSCACIDLTGHGDNHRERITDNLTVFDYLREHRAAKKHLAGRFTTLVVLGHSMGGFLEAFDQKLMWADYNMVRTLLAVSAKLAENFRFYKPLNDRLQVGESAPAAIAFLEDAVDKAFPISVFKFFWHFPLVMLKINWYGLGQVLGSTKKPGQAFQNQTRNSEIFARSLFVGSDASPHEFTEAMGRLNDESWTAYLMFAVFPWLFLQGTIQSPSTTNRVLAGSEDFMISPRRIKAFASDMGATCQLVKGAPHNLHSSRWSQEMFAIVAGELTRRGLLPVR